MKHEKSYIENLRSLVASLQTAQDPDTWRFYAIIMALIRDIQSAMNINECLEARTHSDRLDSLLAECRAAVTGSCNKAIERAAHCLTMLETAD